MIKAVILQIINIVKCITNTCDNTLLCGNGQYYDASNYILHTFNNDSKPTKLGRIEALKTGKVKIGTGVVGAYAAKDEWEFEIWINETNSNQNDDQGQLIKGYIEIEAEDDSLYNG